MHKVIVGLKTNKFIAIEWHKSQQIVSRQAQKPIEDIKERARRTRPKFAIKIGSYQIECSTVGGPQQFKCWHWQSVAVDHGDVEV